MKANVHVQVPTELVEIYSSRIAFNHDSLDRQWRRAKDLKYTIELDVKTLNLLEINPDDMRTVYSSHLKVNKRKCLILIEFILSRFDKIFNLFSTLD